MEQKHNNRTLVGILGYDEVFPTLPTFREDMKCEYSTLSACFLCIPLGPETLKVDHADIAKQQTCELKRTTQVLGYIHVTLSTLYNIPVRTTLSFQYCWIQ